MTTPTPRSRNILWQPGAVSRDDRARLHGHRGATVWLTGLPGSGKTTLARALERALVSEGVSAYVLDGDNLRHGLNRDLGFSPADRQENIRRVAELARLFCDAGLVCVTAFISPYAEDRRRARAIHEPGDFIEVHVQASLECCESRDPKGLYARARAGEISDFTGVSAPYEAPTEPELVLHTEPEDVEDSVRRLHAFLRQRGLLEAPAASA